jgi:hypothetical protein
MKKTIFLILSITVAIQVFSQEFTDKIKDSLYKEDQFYIGTTYNLLGHKPEGLKQTSFSLGFHLGFIKDMPISKRRHVAIGVGLGYSTNSYIQNLLIQRTPSGDFNFSVIDGNTVRFTKNKFSEHVIELPIELRWRTSTVSSYKFWRVYVGMKLGYVFTNRSKFEGSLGDFTHDNISNYTSLQYGPTLSVGYNTWNIFVYYGLNPIFSNTTLTDGSTLDVNAVKIGLIFYIL